MTGDRVDCTPKLSVVHPKSETREKREIGDMRP
jgi:hypothetical protein